ncbi:hypothetical protein GCK72_013027 [Caenorhabditis remanei]|uniref:YitH/HolE acetyltransferase (GNAT) domain-containing protein n=1 Tax=Caenorhabditis remanei TaxID=31234 RepID=A0A6A5GPJ1_CAERE|nr:hypothetical protein GCK72_013027 [Caenorhabditis remanei]KAF1756574.1 hypothetical protein GCK72_013027 [Caenorhabditis remanei]
MTELETLVNPPQEVFEEIVKLTSETEDWAFQLGDYQFWSKNFDQFWLFTIVEKETKKLVSSVSLARWDGEDGPLFSVGMFYCVQKYRGTGLGKPLFKKVMDIVGDNNATLTGVVKMSAKYASDFGFDKVPEHWHLFSSLKCADVVIPDKVSEKYTTKLWSDVDYDALTAYDRTICVRDRKKMMTNWFNLPDTFTRVVFDESGKIVGYSTIRLVSKNKMSPAPFYADNLEAAEVLLKDLLNMIPNWQQYASFGFLHPDCNKDPLKLLEKFAKSNESVSSATFIRSQFTKKLIPTPDQKVYALADCAHQFV